LQINLDETIKPHYTYGVMVLYESLLWNLGRKQNLVIALVQRHPKKS